MANKVINLNEVFVPIFERRAEDGFNVTSVEEGLTDDTLFVEIEEWTNIVIDHKGATIYQGDKGFHFDSSSYESIAV